MATVFAATDPLRNARAHRLWVAVRHDIAYGADVAAIVDSCFAREAPAHVDAPHCCFDAEAEAGSRPIRSSIAAATARRWGTGSLGDTGSVTDRNVLGGELEPCGSDPITGFLSRWVLSHWPRGPRQLHDLRSCDVGVPRAPAEHWQRPDSNTRTGTKERQREGPYCSLRTRPPSSGRRSGPSSRAPAIRGGPSRPLRRAPSSRRGHG